MLRLRTQVDPFGVTREIRTLARDAGYQVYVGMEVGLDARRAVDKAGIETRDINGRYDAPAELGQSVPHHVLLLDVEIVEGGDVTARGDYQVAGGDWFGMRHGDHKLRKHPGVVG